MRVFVTGGTGYIGSAVVREFLDRGHEVLGLVRSRESEERLRRFGGEPVEGDMVRPESYLERARRCDALIHMAADYGRNQVSADRTAVETLLTAAEGGEGPEMVVYTSGCWVLGDTGDEGATERTPPTDPAEAVAWRPAHERRILGAANQRLATAVVRPGMVYGGSGGLVSELFATALEEGAARYVGDGENRWSLVHREDVAALYLTVAHLRARGVFHATDGSSPRVRELARAASEAAGAEGATRSVSVEDARSEMGPVADAVTLDQVILSPRSMELGWAPDRPPFLEHAEAVFREWREREGA